MKKRMLTLFATFAMTLVSAAMAEALPLQTFVSSTGNDANDCTQSTPCRTFAGALPKTSARGIITALDSSTYGIVTIDKAVTLQAAPGVYAALQGGRADDVVTIGAGGTDVVVLRNLHIISRSVAANIGIVGGTGTLYVESCIIEGFGDSGISAFGPLFVIDTIVRDNATGMKTSFCKASIDHCRIEHNHTGLLIQQGAATIRDCLVAGNSDFGLKAVNPTAAGGVENCVVTHNGTGIEVTGPFSSPPYYVSTTMIVDNILGVNGGLVSFGNNRLAGNQTNGAMITIQQQ